MTDVDVLAECLQAAMAELLDTVPAHRRRSRAKPVVSPSVEAAANPRPKRTSTRRTANRAPSEPAAVDGAPEAAAAAPEKPAPESTVVRPKQVSSSASRGLVARSKAEGTRASD